MRLVKNAGKLFSYYSEAGRHRAKWQSGVWRVFVVLLLVAGMFLVKEYLENKYLAEFSQDPLSFLVLDKVMYWFSVGVILGAFAMAVMFEGEFVIGLWRNAVRLEAEAMAELEGRSAAARKAVPASRREELPRAVGRKKRPRKR